MDFESTGFSAGRMVKNDYLCSVRVVTDARGEVLERNDYSGFGKRLASSVTSPAAEIANRYRFSGKEEQAFAGLAWQDFGARMYDPDLARWTAPDPLADKYPGISPYVYCNDNPLRYVDVDGMDWRDKAAGYSIGLLTNLVSGTGSLRDKYSPSDPSDYNIALRDVDMTMFAVGKNLAKAGGAMVAGGGAVAVAGVSMTVTTAGVAVIVSGPVTVAGADITASGIATSATGVIMMSNSAANQGQGYERGKANATSPTTGKSINQRQQDVKKGKAPKGLKRFDRKHTEGGQEHIHFEDGSALNKDGSWKEGEYKLNKNQAEYLKDNGWNI